MKRFSVLVVVLFCLGYIITNFNKADFSPDNIAKEILAEDKETSKENKDQSATTEKDCSAYEIHFLPEVLESGMLDLKIDK